MIVDANLLLYTVDRSSPHHVAATAWWESTLSGDRRVGLPWESLLAFVRLATNPRIFEKPMSSKQSWDLVESWTARSVVWHPVPTDRHSAILGELVVRHSATGNLVPDAHLGALAIAHGLTVYSADSDFARFAPDVSWINPLLAGPPL